MSVAHSFIHLKCFYAVRPAFSREGLFFLSSRWFRWGSLWKASGLRVDRKHASLLAANIGSDAGGALFLVADRVIEFQNYYRF